MAIFLANQDVEHLISMRDCIDSVEQAYRELGMGRAWNNPRIHTYGQAPDGATHFLKRAAGVKSFVDDCRSDVIRQMSWLGRFVFSTPELSTT